MHPDLCFHLFSWLVFDLVMSELHLNCFKMLKLYLFPIHNFHCGLRLLVATVSIYIDSCFLQHSFSYFNSLLCTWLMIFRDRHMLVGCRSHRLMKKLGVLLSELLSPQYGRVSQRLLNDWTLLHSASLMDGKQGWPLFHPDSLTRLIY